MPDREAAWAIRDGHIGRVSMTWCGLVWIIWGYTVLSRYHLIVYGDKQAQSTPSNAHANCPLSSHDGENHWEDIACTRWTWGDAIPVNSFLSFLLIKDRNQLWVTLSKYKFAAVAQVAFSMQILAHPASPLETTCYLALKYLQGHGMDTHRLWEVNSR